jgi:large subunit ribosomal protein L5
MPALKDKYDNEIVPGLKEHLGRNNPMSLPRVEKVVVSMGVGLALQDKKRIETSTKDLATIVGQRPVVCRARKSVSNFKVRAGNETGVKVTLRGSRMYEFLERLLHLAVPRIRDFRGLNPQSFDGRGNYSMGLSEQSVFPEIDPDGIEHPQGMNITVVTSARTDSEALELLTRFGFPFRT